MFRIISSGNILRKKFIGSKEIDILKTPDTRCEIAELLALETDGQRRLPCRSQAGSVMGDGSRRAGFTPCPRRED